MLKLFSSLLLIVISGSLCAQPAKLGNAHEILDVTNIRASVKTGGDMFLPDSLPGFEVPRGSGKMTILGGALWLGGYDNSGQLYVAQQTYRQGSTPDAGYWPGPVSNTQGAAHSASWDKVWKVSCAEIQNHAANYNAPGYTMPSDIATWPGNGNTAIGEAAQLAPYADLNGDGIYNPLTGEYPLIKGDQALYLILNDAAGIKKPTSPAMGIEVHAMFFGFDNPAKTAIYNTVATEYRIINRGNTAFHDLYAGIWLDFDLGYPHDDFVGSDTLSNRFYCYNAGINDSVYGQAPPVQSVQFLDRKMSHFMYYNNIFSQVGNPESSPDYYNYLRSIWRDLSHLSYGGNGYSPTTGSNSVPCNYAFPGNPLTLAGWSGYNLMGSASIMFPYDLRGVGTIGPLVLVPGQEFGFSVAHTFSQGTSNLNSLAQAQADADTVRNFFRVTQPCVPTTKTTSGNPELTLFPNPGSTELQIFLVGKTGIETATIRITDLTGKEILKTTTSLQGGRAQHLNIASLSKGMYLVSVTSGDQTTSAKLVKL